MNPRLTPKDRGLIKGAVRRAFSRSDLRRQVLEASKDPIHTDLTRPRVKTWYKCEHCKQHFAGYQMQVDHKTPIIPVESALEHMSWDDVINRTWCDRNNLQSLCLSCHDIKSKDERALRKLFKQKRK